jgi:hypothetical protein
MKSITGILATVGIAGLLSNQPALAGEGKKTLQENVAVEEARKWWGASVSTGWDSLYMFRGVNVIRFDQDGNLQRYGSSLYWTLVNVSFMPTEHDTITLGGWMAFGLGNTRYKEFDATVNYVHTFGDLAVGMGYTFYYFLNSVLYQNELNWTVAYTFHLPAGITASSYLIARLDAGIPIYKDIISLAPWFGFAATFDYNPRTADNEAGFEFFTGANHVEVGIGLPIKINNVITVYGYGAYSYQWEGLVGTEPSTFWGGAKVTFSF